MSMHSERADGGLPCSTPRQMRRASSMPETTSSSEPGLLADAADDLVAVLRLAQRAGGHRADLGVVAPAQRAVAPQRREQPVGDLAGDDPGPEHALARPHRIPLLVQESRASRSARQRASSSRTALVPTSMAASTGSGTGRVKGLRTGVTMSSDAQGRGLAGIDSSRHRHPSGTAPDAAVRTLRLARGNHRPPAVHQPRALLARLQRARPGGGAGRRAAARTSG